MHFAAQGVISGAYDIVVAAGVEGMTKVPMGASVVPMRSTDSIMWTVKFRNGTLKRFKFPIRTTPEGKAEPTGGFATEASLDDATLFTEPESLGLPAVWTK